MEFFLTKSEAAFQEAKKVIPGGVNSPVRSFLSVGGTPPFIEKAAGSRVWDIDGNEYIDYVGSWGPMILGHAHPKVLSALEEVLHRGTSYGAPTLLETEMAEKVCQMVPSIEMVRMVNSGTEATMSALRLARAFTGREKIIKIAGCYHGHNDSFLVEAGSGLATLGIPGSPGVPKGVTGQTLTVPYNDLAGMASLFSEFGSEIAGVILEPVPGNMGMILPQPGYLEGVRCLTEEYGALLIFDEVMSGFRVAKGGAQEVFGIKPDLTTLGKVIGGGLPVGAYGGRRDIMEWVAPAGPMYQAGTLSGNPLAMAAGLTTLEVIEDTPNFYEDLSKKTSFLMEGFKKEAASVGITLQIHHLAGMMGFFFNSNPVVNYESAKTSDGNLFNQFFNGMLKRGCYLAPSAFEAGFMSNAHTVEDLEKTIQMSRECFVEITGK